MPWREQYDRMKRWQYRIWVGVDPIMFGSGAVDTFYAFAQTCSHLVDWLDNDHAQHVRRAQAEAFVNADPVLAFCRDICNGSKHAQLAAKKVKVTSQTTKIGSYQIEDDSGHPVEHSVEETRLFIDYGSQPLDVEAFGALCIAAWDGFLRKEGLLPESTGGSGAE